MNKEQIVIIKGAGDLASGVAHKLFRCGFKVIMTEVEQPTCVRRSVSFANCIYQGTWEIEGVKAQKAKSLQDAVEILGQHMIAVLVDPDCRVKDQVQCIALVDGILAKKNTGTEKKHAPIVIGLGPGFTAGVDVDYVIETNRGHHLGRILTQGQAEADTGIPGGIDGYTTERLLRSPGTGYIKHVKRLGDIVEESDLIALVDGKEVRASMKGVLRGLIEEGLHVTKGYKIGDIDPRMEAIHWVDTISDKARCIAGGVLEAILMNQEKD